MVSESENLIEKECLMIHKILFGQAPPSAKIITLYKSLNTIYFNNSQSLQLTQKLVNKKTDLEAIEYALRIKNNNNILTKKFRSLTFICEGHHEYYTFFVNDKDASLKSFLLLTFIPFRAIFMLIKGKMLIKIYGI